ncbi:MULTISPECIES: DUF4303 domain-containing protein [Janthinobacterium]|uniref:DUF4303 domain-containing protein n=1 Tax=Janthinobacterium lividum TaxID=29581 RepID=A0ABU0XQ84_9BURK|nr:MULTISPECIES: DUF4303 domain-containing protein [Janthinobacterium]MDQ4625687.1 hypothetical protein [Janthinobacterium lividum]MDQ4672710.1 hypothetical protein [Janthinobacterium lividum]MDQ4683438.1 hypothetical protein [Janthinobacterium lividum]QKY10122.1 DUF4303 domain-containing protein [Janthinobacterium lividum]
MPPTPALPLDWQTFETAYDVEETCFKLASASLALLGASPFKDQAFSAFAFNAVSFPSLSLSLDTDPANRERDYYPPDWSNECIEVDVPEIGQLWEEGYARIEGALLELIDAADDELLDAIEEGYLHSLRKTMVRLETSQAFEQIRTCPQFWTVVTQIDADTEEEERLLDQVRQGLPA